MAALRVRRKLFALPCFDYASAAQCGALMAAITTYPRRLAVIVLRCDQTPIKVIRILLMHIKIVYAALSVSLFFFRALLLIKHPALKPVVTQQIDMTA